MASPLVRTKLYVPRLRRNLVARVRLSERLDAGADAKLVVVSAPAGFGKTTAVAAWLEKAPGQNLVAWLSLEESDRESSPFMIGVVSLLAVVTLRQDFVGATGADQSALLGSGHALVAVRDWTFQFGPNLCAGINAILFGTLLYRSRLVPRAIPTLGLIGAPLLLAVTVATALGLIGANSALFGFAVPVAVWEVSIGTWMLVKGFKPSPLTAVA